MRTSCDCSGETTWAQREDSGPGGYHQPSVLGELIGHADPGLCKALGVGVGAGVRCSTHCQRQTIPECLSSQAAVFPVHLHRSEPGLVSLLVGSGVHEPAVMQPRADALLSGLLCLSQICASLFHTIPEDVVDMKGRYREIIS